MARFYNPHVRQTLSRVGLVREFDRIGSLSRVMVQAFATLDEAAAAHAELWRGTVQRGYLLS